MDKGRKGEIALMVLKRHMKKDGTRIGDNMHREANAVAKDLGIEGKELLEFLEEIIREITDEIFSKK